MERLTKVLAKEFYIVDSENVSHDVNGYTGEAINKLAKFENMYDDLISKQSEISIELEELRAKGKTNSVRFKQLLANKLNNNNVLILLKTYGLE